MTAPAPISSARARPRRILIVEINHDGTFGGSHQAMCDLVRHLDRERFDPVALFYEDNPYAETLRAGGHRVLTWDAEWEREHGVRARWFSPRRIMLLGEAVARRVALLKRERIDLVHINNSPSYSYYDWLPAARIAGVPCVTHLRGELYPINNRIVHWLNCRFDRYIAISTYVAGILTSKGFPRERILQIEDGIDIDRVRGRVRRRRADMRAELGVPDDALLAVMAGHLREWKGQDVVLRAISDLAPAERRQLHVAFAGADDPHDLGFRRKLDAFVREHHLDDMVHFLGQRSDVPDLMNAADVVLHASTRPEPFGLVVLEGLALGRLVIAAALGGPTQILDDGSGWVFDPARPAELTALLRRLIVEPELAAAVAPTAIARANAFTVQRTARRVESVYDQLFARAIAAAPRFAAASA